tara:strand:- start:11762 stop:13942 length:2181 start_codon:yes stop_codon:yes gene_type:complete
MAGAAFAQSEDTELRGESVIVTAPGPEKLAGELISKVDALDRAELISDMQGTLGDTLAKRPGVTTTYFGAGASRPVLRGLGAERVLVLTNGMGVIDASAASPDHQAGTDGLDAERVEILRGPAALAYGGQAIGGVVNVIDGLMVMEKPDKSLSGQGFGAFNSVNEGSEFAGQGGVVFGDFVLKFTASHRDFDDYEIPGFAESSRLRAMEDDHDEDEHGDHDDDEDDHDDHDHDHDEHDHEDEEIRDLLNNSFLKTDTIGAGLSWVGEKAYIGVAVRRQISDYGLPGHSHEHDHGDEDHNEHHDDEKSLLLAEDDHDDHAHEEELIEEAYIGLEQVRVDVQTGWRFDHDILDSLELKLTSADYEHAEFEGPGEIGTQYFTDGIEGRVELDHSFGDALGTLGIQAVDKEFRAEGEEAFITPTDTKSFGAFLYEAREWESGFGVEGGVRLESVDYDNINFGTQEFSLFSGSFGVHRHFENGVFIGLQASVTDRAPNESELFADGAHLATDQYEVGNRDLDVEKGVNLEATARWTGDNLRLGVNVFRTDFSNFTYLTPGMTMHDGELTDEVDELPVFLFVQEDADFFGGELYGSLDMPSGALGADWTLDAGIDLVEAKLDGGGRVPYIPPVTFNTDVTADWGIFDAGIGVTIAQQQNDPGVGVLETDGYEMLNVSAGLDLAEFIPQLGQARLFVQGRNITDEEIRYATSVLKDQLPAPGRNVRVGLSAKF